MTGKLGAYVCRCGVSLPDRNWYDTGFAMIVRLTDGIGLVKPAYGMWQKPHALALKGDIFLSKFRALPTKTFNLCTVWASNGGFFFSFCRGKKGHCGSASDSLLLTLRAARAISEFTFAGGMPTTGGMLKRGEGSLAHARL